MTSESVASEKMAKKVLATQNKIINVISILHFLSSTLFKLIKYNAKIIIIEMT
jgi:hypothetical protein